MPRTTALLAAAFCAALPAGAQTPPTTLQSSDHDLIYRQEGVAVPPGPAASGRLVTLCLRAVPGNGPAKGLGTRQGAPDRVARPGETVCTRVEPAQQVIYFFKERDGAMRVVLSYPLDLRMRDGLMLTFDWLRDGTG